MHVPVYDTWHDGFNQSIYQNSKAPTLALWVVDDEDEAGDGPSSQRTLPKVFEVEIIRPFEKIGAAATPFER